jgi:hypothetical protein
MDSFATSINPWDIADLSQIVVEEPQSLVADVSPGPGPIRRRKTSLRSNPLALHDPNPRTPSPQLNQSRVHFHNLMPVFSCDPDDSARS